MDSTRLARHRELVVEKFEAILRECRKGVSVSDADRERLGMLKHRTVQCHLTSPHRPLRPCQTTCCTIANQGSSAFVSRLGCNHSLIGFGFRVNTQREESGERGIAPAIRRSAMPFLRFSPER
jgi:hypothetical protein